MGDAGSTRLTAPSPATRRRWNAQYLPLLIAVPFYAAAVGTELAGSRGLLLPLTVIGTLLGMIVAFFGYVAYWTNPAHLPAGRLWVGNGTLRLAQLEGIGLDRGLRFHSRKRLHFWSPSGALSARFEVDDSGLSWTMRFLAGLAGVNGSVSLPWEQIDRIESGRPAGIGGTKRGGRLAIHLTNGATLDAAFLGPSSTLMVQLAEHLQ
jgi:hypothetical protein